MALIRGKQIESLAATKVVEDVDHKFVSEAELALITSAIQDISSLASHQDVIDATADMATTSWVTGANHGTGNNLEFLDTNDVLNGNKFNEGTVDVAYLPDDIFERMVVVADSAARLALTLDDVQEGDCVKQNSDGKMFVVIDDSDLDNEASYQEYAAHVHWATIVDKPEVIGQVGYVAKKKITVIDAQTVINTGITDNKGGTYFTDTTFAIGLEINGVPYVNGAGEDFTVAIVSNEFVITWLPATAGYALEAVDEVVVVYTQLV